jgi:phosphoribosylformylglycinamidine cyclo-ligase
MGSKQSVQHTTLSYQQAGVNYDLIDPLKVAAQRAAAATSAK